MKTEIINYLSNFANIHIEELKGFKKQTESDGEISPYDFLPPYHSNEASPIDSPLIQEAINHVREMLFGKNMNSITYDIDGHMPHVHGKSIAEIDNLHDDGTGQEQFFLDRIKDNFGSKGILKNELFNNEVFNTLISFVYNLDNKFAFLYINDKESLYLNISNDSPKCSICDTHCNMDFDFKNKKFVLSKYMSKKEACPKTSNKYNFNLSVPSKKVIFINDIREVFEVSRKDKYEVSINSLLGKIKENQAYLEHNIAYVSLSDGAFDVLQHDNKIVIDPRRNKYYADNGYPLKPFEDKGSVDLAIWSTFILDYELMLELCEKAEMSLEDMETEYQIVEVGSGQLRVNVDYYQYLIEIDVI